MHIPTLNTLIGAAYIAAIPAWILMFALQAYQWSSTTMLRLAWRTWLKNYRLAVSVLCLATTVVVADIVRLRYAIHLGPIAPKPSTYGVLVIRWVWAVSVYWAVYAMYRHFSGTFYRWIRRGGRPAPKPPPTTTRPPDRVAAAVENDARKIVEIRSDTRKMISLVERLRAIADELNERIEKDNAVALGDEQQDRRRSC